MDKITWTVVSEHIIMGGLNPIRQTSSLGIRDKDVIKTLKESSIPLAELFLLLSYQDGDWRGALNVMNRNIEKYNFLVQRGGSSVTLRPISPFTEEEFIIAHALLIGAADCAERGENLWESESKKKKNRGNLNAKFWKSICPSTDFSHYMKYHRFKAFRRFFHTIWQSDVQSGKDSWWKFQGAVDNFNRIRQQLILPSEIITIDESMSAF